MAPSASSLLFKFTAFTLYFCVLLGTTSGQLSANFYARTCPKFRSVIKRAVNSAVSSEPRMGASLLRLHFHDCFVNGCDGSVLLDDNSTFVGEKTARPNNGSLRGFNVIDGITQLESDCPGVVSCADILAGAARDSVVALHGPSWRLLFGRRDSTSASLSDAISNLPGPRLNLSGLISSCSNKGFTANEMVALSGSHSIGQGRCTVFRNRLYNDNNLNASFAATLQQNCPTTGGDNNLSPLDSVGLMCKSGLFHSDQELFNGGLADAQVRAYASNQNTFFRDFGNAMVKMGNLGPLTGSSGQVRTNCRRVN